MYLRSLLIKILISAIVLGVLVYSSYRLYPIISGPKIKIDSPENAQVITDKIIQIKGNISRAKEVKIFDRIINLDPEGNFEENILRQDVFTDIIITAKDKYNRIVTQKIFVQ
jgi:hypothetical protein